MLRVLPVLSTLRPRPEVGPLVDLLKVLADGHRLAIVALLAQQELCVCHLVDILGLPQSTISHHVGVLRRAGLLRDRRDPHDQRWVYYALDQTAVTRLQEQLAGTLAATPGGLVAMPAPAPPCPDPLQEG